MEPKRLYRSTDNRILGGVAGGLAEYLEVDPTLIRLIFLIALFSGVGVLAYLLAWIIIPENPKGGSGKKPEEEIKDKAKSFANDVKKMTGDKRNDEEIRILLGVLILALGVMFLFQVTIGPFIWRLFWPSILVVIGLYIILKSK